jgi:hypothetical protein
LIEEEGGLNLYGFLWNNGVNTIDTIGLAPCCANKKDIWNKIKEGGELANQTAVEEKTKLDNVEIEKNGKSKLIPKQYPLNEWGGKVCCNGTRLYLSDPLVSDGNPMRVDTAKAKCVGSDETVGLFHNHPNLSDLSGPDKEIARDGKATRWEDKDGDGKAEQPIYVIGASSPPMIPAGRTANLHRGLHTQIYDPNGGADVKAPYQTFSWPFK